METMLQEITDRFTARLDAYTDLADLLDDNLLGQRIDVPKHKSLAEHLWCIVGARESYSKAIDEGEWSGFSCSLQALTTKDIQSKLIESASRATEVILAVEDWTPERTKLLATLVEHETMHEGQIIRHMYAIGRTLPESWVWA
ncbi:MAG: hypothetical protein GKR90_17735 [Pseudomonadales bacterium]|nr:hypothetical protein [Pseudomonadales bacterium]